MKARIAVAVGMLGLVVSTVVNAGWSTTVQDDIFSGGKTAMLIGYISPYQSVVVDCNSEGLSLALLQEEKWPEGRESSSWNLLVKVDGGAVHRFTAASGRRNDKFSQYATAEQDEILKVLEDLRSAKSQVLFGLQSEEYNAKWSGTAPVNGSTSATDRFMQACKLKGA
ncbi:hypothetical protein [Pseudomonas petrae]|uniref:Uncharacterized protein n=1 Tax=Pseudomonas petrae TaxID=2912190 RepID=A0ABS9IAZ8_9PSED|nr:hypothetical protein [Pseudomonas petrae]MCF7544905.1 hypothetical protein [Pseudomonas petrae]